MKFVFFLFGTTMIAVLCAHPGTAIAGVTISATSVDFGNYFTLNANPNDSTGTITFTCSGKPVTPTYSLSTGNAGSYTPRTMTSGANTLNYNLYLNAARSPTQIFGDGTSGTVTYTGPGCHNESQKVIVYGRITPQQNVTAGLYADSIIVTVNF